MTYKNKKRVKQIIAMSMCLCIIIYATFVRYETAKATGLGAAAGAAAGTLGLSPAGAMLLLGSVVGLGIATVVLTPDNENAPTPEEYMDKIESAGKQMADDFYNHSVQAINNNINSAEMEKENAAHVRATIDDFMETLGNGFIDTSSEAWDWFQDFVNDITGALSGGNVNTGEMNMLGDYPVLSDGRCFLGTRTVGKTEAYYYLILQGVTGATGNMILARNPFNASSLCVYDYTLGELQRVSIESVQTLRIDHNEDGSQHEYKAVNQMEVSNTAVILSSFGGVVDEWAIPIYQSGISSAPAGTTDVPGVSRPSDYVSVGNDLPIGRPDGAWDICDPQGKQGQVEIGMDIPQQLGYDDWYDLIGGIIEGNATWEDVANASDVIIIGSDTADSFTPSDASSWGAYVDCGVVVSTDVDADGNMTITLSDGRVITISSEYAGDVTVTSDGVTIPLESVDSIPAQGTISIPLPAITDIPAEPDPFFGGDDGGGGGSGSGDMDESVKPYVLDFRNLFPFCIPYDIYRFIDLLDATPQAPVIHYKFYLNKSHVYTIDLNLNKFNSVARILRTMECLLFIIGLATATRRIYIRG